eukprot:COSAG02_NODE_7402_length_3033_cov_187.532567_1_plen_41_part_10
MRAVACLEVAEASSSRDQAKARATHLVTSVLTKSPIIRNHK